MRSDYSFKFAHICNLTHTHTSNNFVNACPHARMLACIHFRPHLNIKIRDKVWLILVDAHYRYKNARQHGKKKRKICQFCRHCPLYPIKIDMKILYTYYNFSLIFFFSGGRFIISCFFLGKILLTPRQRQFLSQPMLIAKNKCLCPDKIDLDSVLFSLITAYTSNYPRGFCIYRPNIQLKK